MHRALRATDGATMDRKIFTPRPQTFCDFLPDWASTARAAFGRPLYGGAAGLKVVRSFSTSVRGASTLTLLAPPRFFPLGIARGELHLSERKGEKRLRVV